MFFILSRVLVWGRPQFPSAERASLLKGFRCLVSEFPARYNSCSFVPLPVLVDWLKLSHYDSSSSVALDNLIKNWELLNDQRLAFASLRCNALRCLAKLSIVLDCSFEQAKPETVSKVVEIVKKQLALPDDRQVSGDSKFQVLGADSLDTVILPQLWPYCVICGILTNCFLPNCVLQHAKCGLL